MAEEALSKGIHNIKYSFISQIVILIVGVLKTLIVPSVLTVETYAYWQMYLFYISYIGFFYLGFNDGILLKYGKYNYKELPFEKLRSSMMFYIAMLSLFSAGVFIFSINIQDSQKSFVMLIVSMSIVMMGLNGVMIYVFLITNQIKRHSLFSAVDSVSILVGALALVFLRKDQYQFLVYFVFTTKLISVTAMCILCKDLLVGKQASLRVGFVEFIDNIKVGSMLMIAQIMSMLITGIGRMFIEYTQDVSQYAYYSFGMTIINVIMVAVVAVSTVMYPTLGRIDTKLLPIYFKKICAYITDFNVLALLAYFPAYILIGLIFPKYASMLPYLSVFFAMLTWQAKTNIITNSYFRVLRMEKQMLRINSSGVLFFCCIMLISLICKLNQSVNTVYLIAAITGLTTAFIEIYAESKLRNNLGLCFDIVLVRDIVVNTVFLVIVNLCSITVGFLCYLGFILVYIMLNLKRLKDVANILRYFHTGQ
ncbi:MAG: hypothetical protein RR639_00415 [Hydrogenoanaerobacterium sp.]